MSVNEMITSTIDNDKSINEIIDDRIKLCCSNLMIFDERNNNIVMLMLKKLSSEIREIIDDNIDSEMRKRTLDKAFKLLDDYLKEAIE